MLGAGDLVLCTGTLLARPWRTKMEAAAAAGFAGVSMFHQEYRTARREGLGDADIRAVIADLGLEVAETEVLAAWVPGSFPPPGTNEIKRDLFATRAETVLDFAVAVGAGSVTAAELFGAPVEVEAAAAAFASICDLAAERGLVVNLEALPWSGIRDVNVARAVVETAGRSNAGLTLDVWHLTRAGLGPDDVAGLPGSLVTSIQLSDGPAVPGPDLEAETIDRLFPGRGDFPLVEIVRALAAIGCEAPIGVEVFTPRARDADPVEIATEAMTTTREVLEQAGRPTS